MGSNCAVLSTQLTGGAADASDMSVLTGAEASGITNCDDDEEADVAGMLQAFRVRMHDKVANWSFSGMY